MKILYFGSFFEKNDEGLTQLSKIYINYFNRKYNIKYFRTIDSLNISSIKSILKFKPNIIHYLTGPTLKSFLITYFYKKILLNKPKIIISATRPFLKKRDFKIIRWLKPNLILTQAKKWEKLFNQHNIKTTFLPNPINLNKFRKLDIPKRVLRNKYGLPLDKKLLLHVGHIRFNRNLNFFIEAQSVLIKEGYRIVIVGSTFFETDKKLLHDLINSGCVVINKYISNIEEIYNACDYYIFPIKNLHENYYSIEYQEIGVIDMPLSILEAIACELPIISTEIDSISQLIKGINEPPILFFDGSMASFVTLLKKNIKFTNHNFATIKEYINQENILKKVDIIYKNIYKL